MNRRIRVFAPATVANLGPGFDVLGLALSRPGDELEAELPDRPGVEIVDVTGDRGPLSRDPGKNVVGTCRGRCSATHRRESRRAALVAQTDAAGERARQFWRQQRGRRGRRQRAARQAARRRPTSWRARWKASAPHRGRRMPTTWRRASWGASCSSAAISPSRSFALPVPDTLHISVVHPHCKVSTAEARRS